MSKLKKITEEELKSIKDQQIKLNGLLVDVGFLESKKHETLIVYTNVLEDMEKTKAELEKKYGPVNINLQDGSYTYTEETKPI
jgi:hypothetical protein